MQTVKWFMVKTAVVASVMGMAFSAQAQTVFHCKGMVGGPIPAQATLTLQPVASNRYSVELQLTNKALPKGITAVLSGKFSPTDHWFFASGKIDSQEGSIDISPAGQEANRWLLQIYAANGSMFDRNVEFGFGAAFTCSGNFTSAMSIHPNGADCSLYGYQTCNATPGCHWNDGHGNSYITGCWPDTFIKPAN